MFVSVIVHGGPGVHMDIPGAPWITSPSQQTPVPVVDPVSKIKVDGS